MVAHLTTSTTLEQRTRDEYQTHASIFDLKAEHCLFRWSASYANSLVRDGRKIIRSLFQGACIMNQLPQNKDLYMLRIKLNFPSVGTHLRNIQVCEHPTTMYIITKVSYKLSSITHS